MTEHASPALPNALAAIVSEQYVSADPAACAEYAIQGVVPGCVVAPGSLEELSAVMQVAYERRAAVTPWGGGTQQNIGAPPARLDLVVRTERLNRVLIHEPDDLTISVEAGITLGALRALAARHGQMLPLDPPLPGRATIGGLLATASEGPRRLGYGTLRELTIGIGVVEASGRISRGGGMVVKNVSGFDMMKLYIGSLGTLAIIASANFKLLPIPRAAATLLCTFDEPSAAFAAIEALHLTQLTPTAAEYLNVTALARALATENTERTEKGRERAAASSSVASYPSALALRAEGLPQAVERHFTEMSTLAARNGAAERRRLDGAEDMTLWERIADLPQTAELAADEALLKLTALPIEVERTVAQIELLAARASAAVTIDARALNGVIYARLRPIDAEALSALLAELPGTQWVATTLPGVPRWGAPPPGLDLMRRIKDEFDPQGMLNQGRYVEGI
ncbi:MAG TPA: FAD-binding oxidoreductase [Roseiflexaceae bacterium]|nr:FAD-binding oxidoreductase [Roseiflexaceae bacterium]